MFGYGRKLKINIFGQAHSPAIGVIIEGFPAGFRIDTEELKTFMERRKPAEGIFATERQEPDEVEFIYGVQNGITDGSPIMALIRNTDIRTGDYENMINKPRPGHADYAAALKFKGEQALSGGGSFSGRMTAPLCAAGALCIQLLAKAGITVGAHIASVKNIRDRAYDPVNVSRQELLPKAPLAVLDEHKGKEMLAELAKANREGDSLGGVIECCVLDFPAGWGDALFDGIESRLSAIVFGIPAVKGIEFGSGFGGSELLGSQNNDEYFLSGGKVCCKSNNHGGILGGISSGLPLIFRVAIKPTPSIAKSQHTVDLQSGEACIIRVKGRHDTCIVPRAVCCMEAAAAICLADCLLEGGVHFE